MASPPPERTESDKAGERTAEKATKVEIETKTNGQASPPSEKTVEKDKPLANGHGNHADKSEETSSDSPDQKATQTSEDVTANKFAGSKDDDASATIATPDEADQQSQEGKEEAKSKDVEMSDKPSEREPQDELAVKNSQPVSDVSSNAPQKSEPEEGEGASKPSPKAGKPDPSDPTSSADLDLKPASMSQLAIDSKTKDPTTPPHADTDVAMPDAPSSSTKVARSREDDAADEPAAKRPRTEGPDDGTPAASQPVTVQAEAETEAEGEISDKLFWEVPGWKDAEANQREITEYRARELRKILAGAKKTKAGAFFRDSVAKLWPMLAESYRLKVPKPMDLGTMERSLRDSSTYNVLGQLRKDLFLLYKNTYIFNGPHHEVTAHGRAVVPQVWLKMLEVSAEEPPRTKPAPKHHPVRHADVRANAAGSPQPAPPRKESRPAAASPAAKPEREAYAIPPGGVPQVRRASTQNESDRPKRAIHPPKNRDIDYTAMQNFNKKKLPLELQFAYDVVVELMEPKHHALNIPFLEPVDPVALQIPNYWSVVKNPMDLGTIKSKLMTNEYQNAKQVQTDFQLVVKNCLKFNGPDHVVTLQAMQLEKLFKDAWAKKDQWMAKNTPVKPVSEAVTSEDSEDGSDEEEYEEEEQQQQQQQQPATSGKSTQASDAAAAIDKLEQRLRAETTKLSQLIVNIDNPDETEIDLQRTIVQAIRKRVLEEREKLGSQKSEAKPSKSKTSKSSSKAKAAASGSKKASTASASRKSGTSGGAKKSKRPMTQNEKDQIANGINDLDEVNIARAIDIIKKDTGQTENDSGELELEIDQLTTDALHKLWDLLKRVLPNFGTNAPSARESSPVNNGPSAKQAPKQPSKPKKNKPMNAREQEARIAELERLKNQYKSGSGAGQEPASDRGPEVPLHPLREESSDSEEE
ncbi:hypothetical protein SODALDRAFT_330175 [Sodiomyces alkalinus F11]|uniref:Bromodomain-containing protein n=1 Tax=Sodiomyces alkalinus (strain CBS 110278 / VKM F-3762 / F11) TaxID=1314773 RepID=A0A3N2Q123_SODAK|nr:hypothetical protein SODALDRAFT_330175 [Sodiomyces alkalinus F11]ROT40459.1 hypothetical protein SODALDRAFT_330175 [Sodiomyces alkalinus F11]